ncbi:MAG TPA: response regulator transcription factor [Solirubrobacter sp.]|jgi:DNA-binding NarL/FixJ family response regulator|nr:response regulator transcription factor [Solirubrobacter sp.]
MIRVVVVDDHPALRAGLKTVLQSEPGIVFAGESSGDEETLWPLLKRVEPDLVLLDYHLPKGDGMQLCYRIKQQVPTPRVIIFSAYASPELVLPGRLAKADAILSKGTDARDLFDAIRRVYAGELLVDEPSAAVLYDAQTAIADEDRAIIGMMLDGTKETEIARTVGRDVKDVRHVVQKTLSALRHSLPIAG